MSDLINEIYLADAVEFIVDNRGRTAPINECGIPLIATNCVSNEHLYPLKEKLRYVSQETYENWFRSHPNPGDILLTNKGSQNGAVCLVPDPVDFCIAQDMVALRADPNKIYPLYLFAVLRSSLVQNRIKELNVDSVIPHFKKTDFNKLYFPLPDVEEQKFIGDLYFKLSYKVELNRQINQTLEAMAQAIFKSWFVDFEPVKAKIAAIEAGEDAEDVICAAMRAISGKTDSELDKLQAEQPEYYAQLKNTAELFPAAMQDSELGEVPEGWEVSIIGEEVDVVGGGTPSTKNPEFWEGGETHWTTPKDLSNLSDKVLLTTNRKITDAGLKKISSGLLPVNTVLMSSRAPVGYLALAKVPVARALKHKRER
jgi:type I restriction enzyme S subunit